LNIKLSLNHDGKNNREKIIGIGRDGKLGDFFDGWTEDLDGIFWLVF
jgi:hypothetical protein